MSFKRPVYLVGVTIAGSNIGIVGLGLAVELEPETGVLVLTGAETLEGALPLDGYAPLAGTACLTDEPSIAGAETGADAGDLLSEPPPKDMTGVLPVKFIEEFFEASEVVGPPHWKKKPNRPATAGWEPNALDSEPVTARAPLIQAFLPIFATQPPEPAQPLP